ncbi:maltooligosyltrehalose trehalohydrolase [Methylacidimicrobium cyclopophantes]|uniref:Malto-oligosyltrehalose trehalohydrolase n=1 Tax=Methylacidimicrobium cyclopophantes TaxID=1041766 RepID=A0A5E6MCT0_9BACT|nr:malto-oligosyltrehalose trehalohydrolase [Methylacidimicrobium cyclopophantes]VVM06740.1 maltooligosyltrehalose trehalohydrolase [Methylacidimicrobium cyclopophantes]
MEQGAILTSAGCRFCVWAPYRSRCELRLIEPVQRTIDMERDEAGYWAVTLPEAEEGWLYCYRLDGEREFPDPASRCQPRGVHGPSQIVGKEFSWTDQSWKGVPLSDYVLYELHVGTFTPEGTFEAILPRLGELRKLGIRAIELMPVAQFPGRRNWGYDGVYPFAVQNSYGGIRGLKTLVNACHEAGLAVVLDVVYNHLGPEGNYLTQFGPYFTDTYRTPWGPAVNFDGADSDEVRAYFFQNARSWFAEFHFDALRLDAVHAIHDESAFPFLEELALRTREWERELGRSLVLFAESDRNDPRLVRPRPGGLGLPAQWCDDFHHALHRLLTGEREGYYVDFHGVSDLAKAIAQGYVLDGRYSAYRRRRHGAPPEEIRRQQLVVFAQNHDQVGNRAQGDRLASSIDFASQKLAAIVVLLSGFLPLLFMGEEYGETHPFPYFVDHEDPELLEAVRNGRKREFAAFHEDAGGEIPDPAAEATFLSAVPQWESRHEGSRGVLWELHRELLALRRRFPILTPLDSVEISCESDASGLLRIQRKGAGMRLDGFLNFGQSASDIRVEAESVRIEKIVDSEEPRWLGSGALAPAYLERGSTISLPPRGAIFYAAWEDAPGDRKAD